MAPHAEPEERFLSTSTLSHADSYRRPAHKTYKSSPICVPIGSPISITYNRGFPQALLAGEPMTTRPRVNCAHFARQRRTLTAIRETASKCSSQSAKRSLFRPQLERLEDRVV